VPKFRQATSPNSKALIYYMLSQFFTPFKNVRGNPVPGGGALARLGHSLAHVKIRGHPLKPKIWSSEKVDLDGYDST